VTYLSDRDIQAELLKEGGLRISPWPGFPHIQPASVEYRIEWEGACDVDHGDDVTCDGLQMVLQPGEFRLANTRETITIPDYLLVRAEGKSSWARMGLLVHATAGHLDPGFTGQVTLELKNLHHENPITIPYDAWIGQFLVCRLSSPTQRPYGHPDLANHYQGQVGTTSSWMAG
jgi:dCTP deaminase